MIQLNNSYSTTLLKNHLVRMRLAAGPTTAPICFQRRPTCCSREYELKTQEKKTKTTKKTTLRHQVPAAQPPQELEPRRIPRTCTNEQSTPLSWAARRETSGRDDPVRHERSIVPTCQTANPLGYMIPPKGLESSPDQAKHVSRLKA